MPLAKKRQTDHAMDHRLDQMAWVLEQSREQLTVTNLALKQSLCQHKVLEKTLRKSGARSKTLLKEARALQKHLQLLAHQLLSGQEARRKQISLNLQDEIIQTLVAINVRLMSLKRECSEDEPAFKNDIAGTQHLVRESVRAINQYACELELQPEANGSGPMGRIGKAYPRRRRVPKPFG